MHENVLSGWQGGRGLRVAGGVLGGEAVVVKVLEIWVLLLKFVKFRGFHKHDGRGGGGVMFPNVAEQI